MVKIDCEKYRIVPGDFLLVKVPLAASSPESRRSIATAVKKWCGGIAEVLVVPEGFQLEHYSPQELLDLSAKK